jgi:hypothetical protein
MNDITDLNHPLADLAAISLRQGGRVKIRSSSRQCPGSAGPSYSPDCGLPRCNAHGEVFKMSLSAMTIVQRSQVPTGKIAF